MSTQSKIEHSLNDLIEIARDGQKFYSEAATKVKDAELAALFTRIAGGTPDESLVVLPTHLVLRGSA